MNRAIAPAVAIASALSTVSCSTKMSPTLAFREYLILNEHKIEGSGFHCADGIVAPQIHCTKKSLCSEIGLWPINRLLLWVIFGLGLDELCSSLALNRSSCAVFCLRLPVVPEVLWLIGPSVGGSYWFLKFLLWSDGGLHSEGLDSGLEQWISRIVVDAPARFFPAGFYLLHALHTMQSFDQ